MEKQTAATARGGLCCSPKHGSLSPLLGFGVFRCFLVQEIPIWLFFSTPASALWFALRAPRTYVLLLAILSPSQGSNSFMRLLHPLQFPSAKQHAGSTNEGSIALRSCFTFSPSRTTASQMEAVIITASQHLEAHIGFSMQKVRFRSQLM